MCFDNYSLDCIEFSVVISHWADLGSRVVSPGHSGPDLAQIKPIGPHSSSRPGQCKYTRGKLKPDNKNQNW